jgi:hypothetical protein
MDMDMDMQHGYVARTCSTNKQHGDMDMQQGQAAWICTKDMKFVLYMSYSMDIR